MVRGIFFYFNWATDAVQQSLGVDASLHCTVTPSLYALIPIFMCEISHKGAIPTFRVSIF